MASNKLARKLLDVVNRLPKRGLVGHGAKDIDAAVLRCQPHKVRWMASAPQQDVPVEKLNGKGRGSEVASREDPGAVSTRGARSPFGVVDIFDSFFPDRSFRSMIDTMDRIFDDPFFSRSRLGFGRNRDPLSSVSRTPFDFVETGDSYRMRVDLPGLSKEEVKVYVEDGCLVIKGEHNEEKKAEDELALRSYGSYSSRILLPENAKSDEIKAELKHGVLTVTIPKVAEEPKKTVVDVQVE